MRSIKIELSEADVAGCRELGISRSFGKEYHKDSHFMAGKETWYRDFVWALGEKAYSSVFAVSDDEKVLTCCLEDEPTRLNLGSQYHDQPCEAYVLAWVRPDEFKKVVLIGRITRTRFFEIKNNQVIHAATNFFCSVSDLGEII